MNDTVRRLAVLVGFSGGLALAPGCAAPLQQAGAGTAPIALAAPSAQDAPAEAPAAPAAARAELGAEGPRAIDRPAARGAATAPQALGGPYPSLDHYCALWLVEHSSEPDFDGERYDCHPDQTGLYGEPPASPLSIPPFVDAKVFHTADPFGTTCRLAVRTADGWFVDEHHTWMCQNVGTSIVFVAAEEFAVRDVIPGGSPELVLELLQTDQWDGDGRFEESESRSRVLCGVGSDRPYCAELLLEERSVEGVPDGAVDTTHWAVSVAFAPTGDARVRVLAGSPPRKAVAALEAVSFELP